MKLGDVSSCGFLVCARRQKGLQQGDLLNHLWSLTILEIIGNWKFYRPRQVCLCPWTVTP